MGEGVRRQVYNILLKNIDKHYQEKTCLFHTALTNTLNNFQNFDGRLRTEACHHKQTKSVMTAYLNLYQRKSILPNWMSESSNENHHDTCMCWGYYPNPQKEGEKRKTKKRKKRTKNKKDVWMITVPLQEIYTKVESIISSTSTSKFSIFFFFLLKSQQIEIAKENAGLRDRFD